MKNYLSFNVILFMAFLLGTILTIFIIVKDIDNSLSITFVIGYVIFLFLYVLFSIMLIFVNIRKLNWIQIRKRLLTFIIYFVSLNALHFLFSYFLKRSEMDIWDIAGPLGVSIGLAFSDLMTWKRKA
ncbi:hypothetical protein [Peribacillus muralis]|uniref:hypothetical protein n=1 Tax=Peribacillus muralis TaxID=264697 RepID=UPI00070C6413|nr:hypothetical protein [Peribacillus muralis]